MYASGRRHTQDRPAQDKGIVATLVAAAALASSAPPVSAAPARMAVTVGPASKLPVTAKPDGGLRVVLRADAASGRVGARRALAEIVSATGFTAPAKAWDTIRAGRQAVNLVVRGAQTAPPVTGPYDSCPVKLGS